MTRRTGWLLGACMAAMATANCAPQTAAPADQQDAVEDHSPMELTWVAPLPEAEIEVNDPVQLTLLTENPDAHVVRFTVDGAEVGVCDPAHPEDEEGEDCRVTEENLWRWTVAFDAAGHHVLAASFVDAAGNTVQATREVDVLPVGMAATPDDGEAPEDEADPLTADELVDEGGDTVVDDGTATAVDAVGARGYLDPSRGWHNVFGGRTWRVQGQRVLLRSGRIDGSASAAHRCWNRYGTSIRRYADRYRISRASVIATLITESNCSNPRGSSDGLSSGPMQVTASTCASLTHLSRSTCRRCMHSTPDFAIEVGVRYMASGYQRRQHRNDPPKIAAAYNAGSIRYTRRNHWHMVSTGNHIDRWVGAYNAYRTWESRR